jgi:hypothetical protein
MGGPGTASFTGTEVDDTGSGVMVRTWPEKSPRSSREDLWRPRRPFGG